MEEHLRTGSFPWRLELFFRVALMDLTPERAMKRRVLELLAARGVRDEGQAGMAASMLDFLRTAVKNDLSWPPWRWWPSVRLTLWSRQVWECPRDPQLTMRGRAALQLARGWQGGVCHQHLAGGYLLPWALGKPLLFREALAGLYEVVGDKYRRGDRMAFKAWLAEQDQKFLANLSIQGEQARKKADLLNASLGELEDARTLRLGPFYRARQRYFEYVYEHEYEISYLFDPVITVHPDELSFEAFSRDESSYARLAAKHELFDKIDSFECGTTNIDFSVRLHDELDRIRTYRRTRFDVSPGGFGIIPTGSAHWRRRSISPTAG